MRDDPNRLRKSELLNVIETVRQTSEAPALPMQAPTLSNSKVSLPPYKTLAVAAIWANVFAIAIALLMAKMMIAVSIACGLIVGLVMYAGIYSFTNGATNILVSTVGGKAGIESKGFMPQFALLTIGKFVLVGALLFAMFRFLHVNMFALMGGFLITQVAVTLICVKSLTATKLVGPKH